MTENINSTMTTKNTCDINDTSDTKNINDTSGRNVTNDNLKSIVELGADATLSGYFHGHFVSIFYNVGIKSINSLPLAKEMNGLIHSTIVCHLDKIIQFGGRRMDGSLSNDLFIIDKCLDSEGKSASIGDVDHDNEANEANTSRTCETKDTYSCQEEYLNQQENPELFIQENSPISYQPLKVEGNPPSSRYFATAISINKHEILYFGGTDGDTCLNESVFILNLDTMNWKILKCRGSPPEDVIGQSVIIWNGYVPTKNIHDDVDNDSLPSIIYYGGSTIKGNLLKDSIYQLDLKMQRWNRIPIKLPTGFGFSTAIRIGTQIGLFPEEYGKSSNIWTAQVIPKHKVFATYMKLQSIFNLNNFFNSFNSIVKYILYFDHKETIALKNKFIKEIIESEIQAFVYIDTSMEVLNSTVLLKFVYQLLDDFPLYNQEIPKKSVWNLFFGRKEKEKEVRKMSDLFFKLPPLFVKIDKTFRSHVVKEMQIMLEGILTFVIGTPWDAKFIDTVNDEEYTDGIVYDADERNIIRAFMQLDHPLEIYNTLRKTTRIEDLPDRYYDAFILFRNKLFEFIKFGEGTREHLGKIKWFRRILFLFRPIISTMNPVMIINKFVNILLLSNFGKHGISLSLELGKTEKLIASKSKLLSPEVTKRIKEFTECNNFYKFDEIRKRYHINAPTSVLDEAFDAEKFEREFQSQLLKTFHLPRSAGKLIFQEQENTMNEKVYGNEIKSNVNQHAHISMDIFKEILFNEINGGDEKINEKLSEDDIKNALDLFELYVRLLEKKDFLQFIEESNIQRLFSDVFHLSLTPMMKMYGNTDFARMFNVFYELLGVQIKYMEADNKLLKKMKKLRKKGEKILSKKSSRTSSKDTISSSIASPSSTSSDNDSLDQFMSEEEALKKAEDATKQDMINTSKDETVFKYSRSDLPLDIQENIAKLEEKRKVKQLEGEAEMCSKFEENFFLFMNESLNNDYHSSKIIRSVAAWLSAYLSRMEDKFIDLQEIFYTEPSPIDQRKLFLDKCNIMLHDKY